MKLLVTSLAAIVGIAGLSGCQPDQEYRLAEACRESAIYIVASDKALEESCACLAKAAVQQLDRDTVEYMIAMFEDQERAFQNPTPESMAMLQKVMDFQLKSDVCLKPLTVS